MPHGPHPDRPLLTRWLRQDVGLLLGAAGTSLVEGEWSPAYTDFAREDAPVKPGLAYRHLRFFRTNRLLGTTTASLGLEVANAGTDLDLAGRRLTVRGAATVRDGATITMDAAADTLDVDGGLAYETRVAANVLAIVERELAQEPVARDGDDWGTLALIVRDRLAVASPKHLSLPPTLRTG